MKVVNAFVRVFKMISCLVDGDLTSWDDALIRIEGPSCEQASVERHDNEHFSGSCRVVSSQASNILPCPRNIMELDACQWHMGRVFHYNVRWGLATDGRGESHGFGRRNQS